MNTLCKSRGRTRFWVGSSSGLGLPGTGAALAQSWFEFSRGFWLTNSPGSGLARGKIWNKFSAWLCSVCAWAKLVVFACLSRKMMNCRSTELVLVIRCSRKEAGNPCEHQLFKAARKKKAKALLSYAALYLLTLPATSSQLTSATRSAGNICPVQTAEAFGIGPFLRARGY